MKSVLIFGGSGMVGQHLTPFLADLGYQVSIATRQKDLSVKNASVLHWNPKENQIEEDKLDQFDVYINLVGANIGAKRWTEERKEIILNSRVDTLSFLKSTFKKLGIGKNKSLISASASGYYGGATTENIYTEQDPPGNDFLAEVCVKWEAAALSLEELGFQVGIMRFGVVFSQNDSALQKIAMPIKYGAGACLGSGDQYVPWVHIDDICGAIEWLMNSEKYDTYNLVAEENITNCELTRQIASVLNKPLFLPNIPKFVLKLLLGDMSIIVLEGSRLSSQKLISAGYHFNFDNLQNALENIYESSPKSKPFENE